MTRIMACIITYNPDIDRLIDNLNSIEEQVECILIVDNNSVNISKIEEISSKFKNSTILKENENTGIAGALHDAMNYAIEKEYDWVLSLDQDSVCLKDLISFYRPFFLDESIGALTCQFKDRNLDNESDFKLKEGTNLVTTCINSGMLMRIDSYKKIDGYRKDLFIDWVDFDICYQLQEYGLNILRVNKVGLVHEVGSGETVTIFGRKYHIFNHNAIRNYYMARNSIIVTRRYFGFKMVIRQFLKQGLRIYLLRYENQRFKKIKARIKGLYDGFFYKLP
ncbi:glycosyltransferase family 2 protein [Enterococcus faecium]|uniref:glycosyltransferase family 2 protein n=1 Tax=Enterococcus faecium TaxID=1352 RepID=UPI0037B20771|nr:glycosyltransferase family 2 protein [Enterococcus faecium]